MEPKFQTSFIPKGNFASPGAATVSVAKKEKTIMGFIALIIFIMAVVAALGVFGYARYLSYKIGKMGDTLTESRNSIDPDAVNKLISADTRITSTKTLLSTHTVISPVFSFLEEKTLKTVRFTEFNYAIGDKGIQVVMKGEASGYQALALQSDEFNKSSAIKNALFSDLKLDKSGNVTFSFMATIDPTLISYEKNLPANIPTVPVTTTTATTSPATTTTSLLTATTTKTTVATTTKSVATTTASTTPTIRR